jgi:two-component system chemotaxis response regulator CheY
MRILIAEDDFFSRTILKDILAEYGDCDIAVDGREAVQSYEGAIRNNKEYSVIFLDIMMPKMDGIAALKKIRKLEADRGISNSKEVKVIMITALSDPKTVVEAYYRGGATAYIVKPIDRKQLLGEMTIMGLIQR